MASFRGIGDAATEVKMKQDQMGLQATLSREARASSEAQADASRAESARQFNVSAGMQQGRLAEDARRFDASMGAQRENTAWERSQAEKKMVEDTRRFGIAQESAARGEQRQERELDLQQFGAELSALRLASGMEGDSLERQKSRAQLDQYLMATEEEKRAKANRERLAKGSFGSLVIAGRLNGGVIPTKALEIANQELGDKENRIIGGGFDENTGLAFFNMQDKDGNVRQLKMTPENQYAAIHEGIGSKEADMFYETFKIGSASRAGIERKRLEMQESYNMFRAKEDYRGASRGDVATMKKADAYLERAKDLRAQAGDLSNTALSDEQRTKLTAMADKYASAADGLLMGDLPQEAKQKPFALTPEMQSEYGIPPAGSKVIPSEDGGYTVSWKDKGQLKVLKFAPGEW